MITIIIAILKIKLEGKQSRERKVSRTSADSQENIMSDKKQRKSHPKIEALCFECEWDGCQDNVYEDQVIFLEHITNHSKDEEELVCRWNGCYDDSFESHDSFYLHISFHGYHSKLMALGLALTEEISTKFGKNPVCQQDPSSRNVLPELPDEFSCLWTGCQGRFSDPISFFSHIQTHAMEDIVIPAISKEALKTTRFAKCCWENCSQSFLKKSHLKIHLRGHTQEREVACPTCGTFFFDRQKFKDHLLRQFSSKDLESIPSHDSRLEVSTAIESRPLLPAGIDVVVQQSQPKKNTPRRVKCYICSKEFATIRLYQAHEKLHVKAFACSLCDFCGPTEASLKKHIQYRHSEERPFTCQFCSLAFKSRYDLRKHLYVHDEEDRYKCLLCPFTSRTSDTLSKHVKTVHEEEPRPVFECHVCGKGSRFSRGNNLSRHLLRQHRLTPPFGQSRFKFSAGTDGIFRVQF